MTSCTMLFAVITGHHHEVADDEELHGTAGRKEDSCWLSCENLPLSSTNTCTRACTQHIHTNRQTHTQTNTHKQHTTHTHTNNTRTHARTHTHTFKYHGSKHQTVSYMHMYLKGNPYQKLRVANMIELLLKSILVYHLPTFEAWKVPKRPVEVSCDVTQHLVAYRTAVRTWTNSSGMCTHTGQHSRLPCTHTLFLLD